MKYIVYYTWNHAPSEKYYLISENGNFGLQSKSYALKFDLISAYYQCKDKRNDLEYFIEIWE